MTCPRRKGAMSRSGPKDTAARIPTSQPERGVPVLFPPDATSAAAALSGVYRSHGRLVVMVVPKQPVPSALGAAQAEQLLTNGAVALPGDPRKGGNPAVGNRSLSARPLPDRARPA